MAADKAKSTIVMMAKDGSVHRVPIDELPLAVLKGAQVALRMADKQGNQHWVPGKEAELAQQKGAHFVQQDGTPYPEGTEPAIVGRNSQGMPVWGTQPKNQQGFISSALEKAGNAVGNAAKGVVQFLDPRATEEEKARGLTTPFDDVMRYPERLVAPNVDAAARAQEDLNAGRYSEAAGHAGAAVLPFVGPIAASVGEQAGQHAGAGDWGGALGDVAGNALAAETGELVPKAVSGVVQGVKSIPGRVAEMQAPRARLDAPTAPGELSPAQRYDAAKDMGVNLDRAQATGASGPGMAKRVTEHSLLGKGKYEANTAANIDALHAHAQGLLDDADRAMPRKQFGEQAQASLQAHKAELTDLPGQQQAAQDLLDSHSPSEMSGEQFGEAAQEALRAHHDSMYKGAQDNLTSALSRKGTLAGLGDVEALADKIYEEEKPYFDKNPWALKTPGMNRSWEIVQEFRSREAEPSKFEDTGSKDEHGKPMMREVPGKTYGPREMSPAMVAKARSDLWNMYQSPEIVGSRAEGWLKQMTGALDESLTSPENEKGLTPGEIQKFRAGTSQWKTMKSMYDDPQSPFFSILRSPEPKTVAGTLEGLKPQAARQFREAMGKVGRDDLVGQQRRQVVGHLLDPTESGTHDLEGFGNRWDKVKRETATEMLGPQSVASLDDLAKKTSVETPYDKPGSQLKQIIDAPDGTTAAQKMFNDSGKLLLTPEEVEQLYRADPDLMPQLQRQTMERLFDPAENGSADLRNFPSRWNRAQKEQLQGVLSPEQVKSLDDMASVSKVVHADSNPSGTAKTGQPVAEVGGLLAAASGGTTAALAGHPLAGAAGVAIPLAEMGTGRAVASRMVDPAATEAVMKHAAPMPVSQATANVPANIPPAARAAEAAAVSGGQPNADTGAQTDRDRMLALSAQRAARQGVSTPPNGGAVTSVDTAEPNEVHDEAKAQAAIAAAAPKPAGLPGAPPPDTAPPANVHGADVYTGSQVPKAPGPDGVSAVEPPEGATHEVLDPDGKTVLGHVVDGEYVPIQGTAA